MSYADLDGVPSQTAGVSSLLASDWNTYVRDNFDSIKFGHVVVADNTAKSAISAVEGIMVYQSDVDTLFLFNGSAWVKAIDTVSLVDLAVTTGKIAASAVTSAKIADDTIVNADVNSAAAIAYSKLNLASSVTSADIVDNTIVLGDLATALQAFLVPTGTVSAYAGSTAPTGYLLCDGAAVSRSTYADLWTALGTTSSPYGLGDGSTTFNTPNLKGRTVIGVGTGTEITGVLGTVQGVKEVTLTGAESGTSAHGHPSSTVGTGVTVTDGGHGHTNRVGIGAAGVTNSSDVLVRSNGGTQDGAFAATNATTTGITAALTSGALTIATSTAAAASSAHTNIQPSMPLNYIIKV